MLFADRLEITNPGRLTPELSIEKLKEEHTSYPTNPRLAEPMYQAGYFERFGTGTGEIFRLTKDAGLKEPEFDLEEGFKVTIRRPSFITDQVTGQATGQASGQVTGQASGQAPDPDTDYKTNNDTDCVTDYDTVYDTTQATDQVDEYVSKLLIVIKDEISRAELMNLLELKHSGNFRDNYLSPAMAAGLVEMTLPDAQNSKNQKYRLTSKGNDLKKKLEKKQ